MGTTNFVRFAQAYGQGNYSDCSYNDNTGCTTSAGSAGGASSGGSLSNTGLMIAIVITLACLAIFVALIVRFWRRPKNETLAEETVEESDDNETPPQISGE